MESFFEKLANSSLGSRPSEHLSLLGKRAAGLYMREEADSLTSAVRSAVGDENLNKDQVRRVAEMANQSTWRTLFHEGGENDTQFEPADADAVLGEMAARPDEVSYDTSDMDYLNDVPNQVPATGVDLAETFGMKVDSEEYAALNPASDETAVAEKTASAVDVSRHSVDLIAAQLAQASEEFYQMVKQAHLTDGVGILQISSAIGQVMQDPTYGVGLMQQVSTRLAGEGVRFDSDEEMRKVAQALVVNTEHPLMVQAAVIEKLAFSFYSADQTFDRLKAAHRHASSALRSKLRGL